MVTPQPVRTSTKADARHLGTKRWRRVKGVVETLRKVGYESPIGFIGRNKSGKGRLFNVLLTKAGNNSMKNHTRAFTGRNWQAVINGKRSLNGGEYHVTYRGVTKAGKDTSVYDVFRKLALDLHEANADMAHIESLQVTIFPSK